MERAWEEGVRFVKNVVRVPVRGARRGRDQLCRLPARYHPGIRHKGLNWGVPHRQEGRTIILAASLSEGLAVRSFNT